MTLKLVIFDCDGVLVDTEPTSDRMLAASLARYGLTLPIHEVGALFLGGTMKSAGETATQMGARLPDGWLAEINGEVAAELAKGVDVYPGLFDLLDALDAAGVQRAIASNGPHSKMEVSLTPSGLNARFAGRIFSGHDHAPKPAPDMLHHAMKVAGATPGQTVFIDDSVAGCKAGIAAGVRTIGFLPEGDITPLTQLGAEPMRHMSEVQAALLPAERVELSAR